MSAKQVEDVLDALATVITPVHPRFLRLLKLKDPADEMVLETAVNEEADRLVTFNVRHLAGRSGIRNPRDSTTRCMEGGSKHQ